ncbi:hypothetical protein ElyMa_000208700 [Elysia marginata]|uniref:Uncharacterized protein n=1 Tax=Elysia marginata TaxID=1093978 RepID=A0AAV4EXB3_9GAST|nr:hypothetical protein ElyMa_000208700 [Elysia marginata]
MPSPLKHLPSPSAFTQARSTPAVNDSIKLKGNDSPQMILLPMYGSLKLSAYDSGRPLVTLLGEGAKLYEQQTTALG